MTHYAVEVMAEVEKAYAAIYQIRRTDLTLPKTLNVFIYGAVARFQFGFPSLFLHISHSLYEWERTFPHDFIGDGCIVVGIFSTFASPYFLEK